jgi:quercetin dioxygenase-like cupin family protein
LAQALGVSVEIVVGENLIQPCLERRAALVADPMTPQTTWSAIVLTLVSLLTAKTAAAQLMSTCVENSPERRGENGCSIIQSKVLPGGVEEPVFWHIDRFDSADAARVAVAPASIAFEAADTWWLMTIESETADHHGGRHVTHVGPLPLPRAAKYAMLVQSAVFMPGTYSLVHHHSGVEAVYVVDGEACYETPTGASKLRKGETLALPGGTPMRAVVIGSKPRHVLAVIVHDAAQPATMRMEEGTGPPLVTCK